MTLARFGCESRLGKRVWCACRAQTRPPTAYAALPQSHTIQSWLHRYCVDSADVPAVPVRPSPKDVMQISLEPV